MNIQDVRERISEFLSVRVRIDFWGLDYPDDLYTQILSNTLPACSAIALPIQNVFHYKEGFNLVKTKARFPYRIAYRFPGQLSFHDLPFPALEGMLSYLQILSLLQIPDPSITSFAPADLEDAVTVSRTEDLNAEGDWVVFINFAFDVEFNTTTIPDLTDLQPPDYYDFQDPPAVEEVNVRINRAKQQFKTTNPSTYILDSEIKINP
ncbi:hypothetical protein H6G04_27110 [Calothrix membranacea FACHB-236]|nr:hypothetical protein [Calothrix membranacea FACHB-236]